jgi:hypothetical protein
MSNAEVIALIDAVLALPVSDSTKNELRSFRLQVQAGTIAEDDRNYVIKLCQRLWQNEGEPSVLSGVDDKRAREEAEDRRKRIERWHQTGRAFESTADLKWLYFDLVLSGASEVRDLLEDSLTDIEQELSDFIEEPIWESVYWRDSGHTYIDQLVIQAARYIDRPLFHCTALRDFFIVRLTESLLVHVKDPIRVLFFRLWSVGWIIVVASALYIFVSWWAAAIVGFLLAANAWRWLRELDYMHKCKVRNRLTRNKINELVTILKRGGYDEPTIIRQLEVLDHKYPPLPRLVYIYSCPYLLGSNQTGEGIQEHTIPVPDVLYALLRLPRRNVQSEIASKVFALDERRRDELIRRWRKFIDPMLTYDEPQVSRT